VLTYDNVGCTGLDADGFCTGGAWPTIPGAHWIWRTQNVTPDEAASGTPVVTFTDTFQVGQAGGTSTLRITADDQYTASVNGTQIGSDDGGYSTVDTYRFTPEVGVNTLTIAAVSNPGPADPYSSPAGLVYRIDTTWHSSLSLTSSRPTVTYGRSVLLKADLTSSSANRTVAIYGQPVGGRKALLKKGVVDSAGTLSVRLRPRSTTTYSAAYTGGDGWSAASAKGVRVTVVGRWSARSVGGYATQGNYRLYHWTKACRAPDYRGCPSRVFRLAPDHGGAKVRMTFQYWKGSHWTTFYSPLWRLTKDSLIRSFNYYDTRDVIGHKFRVLATFGGDANHASATSAWVYWKVTN